MKKSSPRSSPHKSEEERSLLVGELLHYIPEPAKNRQNLILNLNNKKNQVLTIERAETSSRRPCRSRLFSITRAECRGTRRPFPAAQWPRRATAAAQG